jgi:hypothetical protein
MSEETDAELMREAEINITRAIGCLTDAQAQFLHISLSQADRHEKPRKALQALELVADRQRRLTRHSVFLTLRHNSDLVFIPRTMNGRIPSPEKDTERYEEESEAPARNRDDPVPRSEGEG